MGMMSKHVRRIYDDKYVCCGCGLAPYEDGLDELHDLWGNGDEFWCGDEDCAKQYLKKDSFPVDLEDEAIYVEEPIRYFLKTREIPERRDSEGKLISGVKRESCIQDDRGYTMMRLENIDPDFKRWLNLALNSEAVYDIINENGEW
jgi:hypothetical protein